jgi:hypothetical protein
MMDKPLKDWTVGELMQYCNSQDGCSDCDFYDENCKCVFFNNSPNGWYDPRKPKFTEQEREDAKSLLKMFGKHISLANKGAGVRLIDDRVGGMYIYLKEGTFPSISYGKFYTLAEIAGCEDE